MPESKQPRMGRTGRRKYPKGGTSAEQAAAHVYPMLQKLCNGDRKLLGTLLRHLAAHHVREKRGDIVLTDEDKPRIVMPWQN